MVEVSWCVLTDATSDPPTWTPMDALGPAEVLALWRGERVTCCTLQAGFRISVDGRVWNAEAIDEIGMARTWLGAAQRLLDGAGRATVWAWEESQMTLSRHGERVQGVDVHHGGTVVCPPVWMDLRALAHGLADAAVSAMDGFDRVRATADGPEDDHVVEVLDAQLGGDWRPDAAALHRAAARPIPQAPDGDPGPLPADWVAALVGDVSGLTRPDRVVDGRSVLMLAVQHRWLEGVNALLAAGADPERRDHLGYTALQRAAQQTLVRRDALAIVDRLLAGGAHLDAVSAAFLDRPEQVVAEARAGRVPAEWFHFWVLAMCGAHRPLSDGWREAVEAAVASGVPVSGVTGGQGGWCESPAQQAQRGRRPEVAAFLEGLGVDGP